ncbi:MULTISPECIES: polyprenyl synthetase family protein [unclassified Massilia]|uniref:polyprenyl synthetase family protein n=1 Tax=unclassified Massilia TaxID=2609279 RepID=UPI00178210E1|nr:MULTISPECIES: polyprenyl synthetase family protein [unclassified Massilia]MBD8528663.1 polyprenyl synthetase family protein [Massilia sp. CFBP 13647]MBD8672267.1 polyprenyl synthetase family protein [Massilia sp. CFBP 13721]
MTTMTGRIKGLDLDKRGDPWLTELAAIRHEFEERIAQLLPDSANGNDALAAAMRAGTLGAGKRMRPLLLMLVARDLGCASPALTDIACAVEMVHAASLILDDMPCMDNAMLRRGQPTVHVQYGEDVAILASVALLSRAFGVLATAPGVAPAVRARLVAKLAETVGTQGLVRGQFEDLRAGGQRSEQDIATTNELKTGVLLGVSVDMAAILAETDECVAQSLRAFALAAGHAFQIRDDFLDDPVVGSSLAGNESGKDTGKDLGKATLTNVLGFEEARKRLAGYLDDADRHLADAIGARQHTRRFVGTLFGQGAGFRWGANAGASAAQHQVRH